MSPVSAKTRKRFGLALAVSGVLLIVLTVWMIAGKSSSKGPVHDTSFTRETEIARPSANQGQQQFVGEEDSQGVENMPHASHEQPSAKHTRLMGVPPDAMSNILPVNKSAFSETELEKIQERGVRARVLNERMNAQLVALRQRRDASTGAERRELDEAIELLERNVALRSRLEMPRQTAIRPGQN